MVNARNNIRGRPAKTRNNACTVLVGQPNTHHLCLEKTCEMLSHVRLMTTVLLSTNKTTPNKLLLYTWWMLKSLPPHSHRNRRTSSPLRICRSRQNRTYGKARKARGDGYQVYWQRTGIAPYMYVVCRNKQQPYHVQSIVLPRKV